MLMTHKRTVHLRLLMLVTLMKKTQAGGLHQYSVNAWMLHNNLQLNDDKTKIQVFHAKHRPAPSLDCLLVASTNLKSTDHTRNSTISFDKQIEQMGKSAFHSVRSILRIRKFLSIESVKTLVHAFVTSKLDNCNTLLYGLPKHHIQHLQKHCMC